jgi:hypothetical protein
VAVFVKNLTDQVIPVLKLQQVDIPLANRYSRPRTFGPQRDLPLVVASLIRIPRKTTPPGFRRAGVSLLSVAAGD